MTSSEQTVGPGSASIGIVGTFPPRACGLATFTADVELSLRAAGYRTSVVALVDDDLDATDVSHRLIRSNAAAYHCAAHHLNTTTDVVVVQHEFGIYGGQDGCLLRELTDHLQVPYVITLHTVLGEFTASQRNALAAPLHRAAMVQVFTDEAAELVGSQFPEVAARCRVLPHGAPAELYEADRTRARANLGIAVDATVVTTFGLLSPGKGIEQAIYGVAELRSVVDDLIYVVAGRTHPDVARREGERYRDELVGLVRRLGVEDVVVFRNWFHDVFELADVLAASDVFVTPYRSVEQIVSGTLSFAVAAGVPFVSTPYRYAVDLASKGCGVTYPFDDGDALAAVLKEVLTDPERHGVLAATARAVGAAMTWGEVGRRTGMMLQEAIGLAHRRRPFVPSFRHLSTLLDDTAMWQHASGPVPAWEHGYCLDDAARAAVVLNDLADLDPRWTAPLRRICGFVDAALEPGVGARNFMSSDRQWLDEPHAGDHVGRAVWALGHLTAHGRAGLQGWAEDRLPAMLAAIGPTGDLHAIVYSLLGSEAAAVAARPPAVRTSFRDLLAELTARLPSDPAWPWPEPRLRYDAGRLPEALLIAGRVLGDDDAVADGLRLLSWLDRLVATGSDGLRFVGHEGMGRNGAIEVSGDEQPLEAAAHAGAHRAAARATGEMHHRTATAAVLSWFHGANRLRRPVIDADTDGCRDGIGDDELNANQGAESTLAYVATWLAVHHRGP